MSYAPGKGAGQIWFRGESALGTGTGSWLELRPETTPTLKANPVTLVDVSWVGHRHPADCGEAKPVGIQLVESGAVSIQTALYRAASDGNVPTIITLLKSMGLDVATMSGETTVEDDTPAVDKIPLAASVGALCEACQVALTDVTGFTTGTLYWPTLPAAYSSDDITPGMDLPAVPAVAAVVSNMHTVSAKTATTYEVPATSTLQFRQNTWGEHDDAAGDASILKTACACEALGQIAVPNEMGGKYLVDLSFFGYQNDTNIDDIAADSFYDSGIPIIKTDDFRFCFGDANAAGGITYAARGARDIVINPGWSVITIGDHGSTTVGGVQKYMLQIVPPTISFKAYFDGNVKDQILDELEGIDDGTEQTEKYIAVIQPTRNLNTPSLGVWLPNCHLATDAPYSFDAQGDVLEISATYRAGLAGYNSETDIDESGSANMYFAIGSKAS